MKTGTDHGFLSLSQSIGWLPLGDGAYLHMGDPDALVIEVAGVPLGDGVWAAPLSSLWGT